MKGIKEMERREIRILTVSGSAEFRACVPGLRKVLYYLLPRVLVWRIVCESSGESDRP